MNGRSSTDWRAILSQFEAVLSGEMTSEVAASFVCGFDSLDVARAMVFIEVMGRDPSTALIFRERKINFAQDDKGGNSDDKVEKLRMTR